MNSVSVSPALLEISFGCVIALGVNACGRPATRVEPPPATAPRDRGAVQASPSDAPEDDVVSGVGPSPKAETSVAGAPAADAVAGDVAPHDEDPMLAFLAEAIANTSYVALVRHTSVQRRPAAGKHDFEDDLIYKARVLRTFRGPSLTHLTYVAGVERGETASLSYEPVLLTLCASGSKFYWAGTGSSFPADEAVLAAAEHHAANVDRQQTVFKFCDETPADEASAASQTVTAGHEEVTKAPEPGASCRPSPRASGPLPHLEGLDETAVRACLGAPDRIEGVSWHFRWPKQGCAEEESRIEVVFRQGRVSRARVTHRFTGQHCALP